MHPQGCVQETVRSSDGAVTKCDSRRVSCPWLCAQEGEELSRLRDR